MEPRRRLRAPARQAHSACGPPSHHAGQPDPARARRAESRQSPVRRLLPLSHRDPGPVGNPEELCALGRTRDLPVAHFLAAVYYGNLLAVVGRLEDAAEQITARMERARRERNAMMRGVWATLDAVVHLTAGRLGAARAAVESLPPPEQTGATELDMVRMVILVQAPISTDDRNLLQQMVPYVHNAHIPAAHPWCAEQQRTYSLWRRGIVTTSTTRCAGSAAITAYSAHRLRRRRWIT